MLLSPSPFRSRSAIRSRDVSSHLCPLRGRYNAAPRGAAEPERDRGDVVACGEHSHCAGVPQGVRCDDLSGQGWAGLPGSSGVEGQALGDGVAGHLPAGALWGEDRRGGWGGVVCEPFPQCRSGLGVERGDPVLAALAVAGQVRPGWSGDRSAGPPLLRGAWSSGAAAGQSVRAVWSIGAGAGLGVDEQRTLHGCPLG